MSSLLEYALSLNKFVMSSLLDYALSLNNFFSSAIGLAVSLLAFLGGLAYLAGASPSRWRNYSVFTKDTLDEKGQVKDTRVHVTL